MNVGLMRLKPELFNRADKGRYTAYGYRHMSKLAVAGERFVVGNTKYTMKCSKWKICRLNDD